ncbi:flavin reductase family protein [Domibacillus sp. DTU_2020_1001157_1_SI_ALB_TIR_016]|uniref:flavin reductase family protein n=1 Tax=Domibacillus sp. DTU_2020_1001157_1_SI_ALB_TIR_016 TaxID=3077789 RepID=UPI0028E98AEC|nr:flavin reductase family protein [Domibacillus sp. DTU_2020_1001157_1_SI_ALB_TIR_016]WNS80512.1 flavin reductase family protein [Domibacillus sp. DTU_2020_1001157_1_SI_ALB_TIR_016]
MADEQKQQLFKDAMGNYPTGVTVMTTVDSNDRPAGLTVNSFASVSLDPLLILWSIDHKAATLPAFMENGTFAVHILAGNQKDICMTFATKGADRFSTCKWNFSPEHHLPVIEGAFAVFQCQTVQTVEAGDHTILIGEVDTIQIDAEKDPMLYHRRHFASIPATFYASR